jgi:hypothetical protein
MQACLAHRGIDANDPLRPYSRMNYIAQQGGGIAATAAALKFASVKDLRITAN